MVERPFRVVGVWLGTRMTVVRLGAPGLASKRKDLHFDAELARVCAWM